MSSFIYPLLPGQKFPARKSPDFNTKAQKALSGKESRIAYRAYPLYQWELEYEFLSDNFSQAPARTNYVPWSQSASNWTSVNTGTGLAPVIVPDYAIAPDGTLTADRVILNIGTGTTSSDICQIFPPGTNVPQGILCTVSIWMKTNDGSNRTVNISSQGPNAQVTVTPTWSRFTATGTTTQLSQMNLQLIGSGGTTKYADLSIWGAQMEPGSYATAYMATNGASVRVSDLKTMFGFFSQMLGQYDTFLYQDPDFNTVLLQKFATGNGSQTVFNLTATYMPGADITQYGIQPGGAPAPVLGLAGTPEWIQNTNGPPDIYTGRYGGPELLGSASRTNLALQSNLAATWTKTGTGSTLIANTATAPDGTTTAAQYTEGTSNDIYSEQLIQASLVSAGQRITASVWLKYVSRQFVNLILDDGGSSANGARVCFDLQNGLVSSVQTGANAFASNADAQITPFANGWYRCSLSFQVAAAVTTLRLGLCSGTTFAASHYPTITGTSSGFQIWGTQIESGTVPTALIPVTTAHVTVGADYSLTSLTTAGAVNTFQQVQFSAAPANNVPLLWSGSFFYRCRFSDDQLDFGEQMQHIWDLKSVKFEQILL